MSILPRTSAVVAATALLTVLLSPTAIIAAVLNRLSDFAELMPVSRWCVTLLSCTCMNGQFVCTATLNRLRVLEHQCDIVITKAHLG